MAYAPSYASYKSTRPSQRYKLNPIRETTQSIVSLSSEEARTHAPNREEIRLLRTKYYNEGFEVPHSNSEQRMERRTSQRRKPIESGKLAKESSVPVREDLSDSNSRRYRRDNPVDEDEDEQRVSVYRYLEEDDDEDNTVSIRRPRYSTQRQEANFIPDQLRTLRAPSLSEPVRNSAQTWAHRYRDQSQGSRDQVQDTRGSLERRRSYHELRNTAKAPVVRRGGVSRAMSTTSGRSTVKRSASVHARPPPSVSRASSVRSQASARRPRSISQSQHAMSSIDGDSRRVVVARRAERAPSIFNSIFSSQKVTEPQEQIQCLTCLSDDVPISRSAKLACGHRMCNSCLRRVFTMSVTDPAHMPPKCCTADHIPLKHVEKLFDTKFKMKWNRKYQEYTTKNRVYCPARGCGEWIKPANIQIDITDGVNRGRKYGRCSRCRTKVCVTCNGKWHASRECPKDEATARFAEIAKREGWQRCFNCQATVELKEGCNHMTCRCRAEFCMICGAKWKSCDCPWFNHTTVEHDRLQHLNAQVERIVAGAPRYHEEMEMRREQERRDEELARRLQILDIHEDDDDDDDGNRPTSGYRNVYPIDNAPSPFPHDRFHLLETREAYRPIAAPPRPPIPPATIHAPPPPPPSQRILRQRTRAPRPQADITHTRTPQQPTPRQTTSTYPVPADEVADEPEVVRIEEIPAPAPEKQKPETKSSAMAGLTKNTTVGRVKEWRRYVEEDESVPVM